MDSAQYDFDVTIIGAGPGGYVSAIRAKQLGLSVLVIEKDKPAGVCGNWGCIPSKALIHQAEIFTGIKDLEAMGLKVDLSTFNYAMVQQKSRAAAERSSKGVAGLLRKNKIEILNGTAKILGPHQIQVEERIINSKAILLSTGSKPRQLSGMSFDEIKVLSSTGILAMTELPKSLIIIGSGAIGMEFGYIMNSFGVQVTVIEMLSQILPNEDHETAAVVEKAFKNRGVVFYSNTSVETIDSSGPGVLVTVKQSDGTINALTADKILIAAGRVPNTDNLGLETVGIELDRGFVKVGDYYQTAVPSIYAIGDIVMSPLLAHVASAEGEIAISHIAGKPSKHSKLDLQAIPGATYCEPQIASFGLTEAKAKEKSINYQTASFPFLANGKAGAIAKTEGLVKIIFNPDTQEILGGHIVGHNATELIHELLLARSAELLPEDIAHMVHAHPTMSESVMEAALGTFTKAIHI